MANSGVKKVQQKIFGTGVGESDSQNQGDVERPGSTTLQETGSGAATTGQGSGLTVIIPGPKPAPTPPPRKTTSDPSPKAIGSGAEGEPDGGDVDDEYTREQGAGVPFRQRLAERLGAEYKGAERYRLRQDDKREKHWKRWGPYLSDRQWVGFYLLNCMFNRNADLCFIGDC